MVTNALTASDAVTGINQAFDLDGSGAGVNDADGSAVVECVIPSVSGGDALALSALLDGASLSASDAASADLRGRVKYAAITNGLTTVYIYVTHR